MNISPLLSTAAGIRDEKARAANTATRVGTLLYNMCLGMADTDATASDGLHMAQNLGQWLTTHDNLTTIDALNAALDAMNVDTPQGLHCFKCFGIPLFVTFANLNADDSVLMQTIQGSITFNSAKTSIASINKTGNLTIAVRYYQGGKWGSWNTPMAQIKPPTVQTSSNGTTNNYIYSNGTDADKNCVASCNWWIYSEDGRIYVRWKRWGADDNTHYDHDNEEHQTSQYMLPYMGCDDGACYQDGLLPWQWGQRMKDCGEKLHFIREEQSTAEQVILRYLNFANGSVYDTPISKATSAKAGVMTAAQATQLGALDGGIKRVYLGGNTWKFRTLAGDNVIETHSDYVGEEVSLDDFQNNVADTTYNEGDPIEIFITKGAYGVPAQKYMIWFGRRWREASGSSKDALQRYDFKTIAGMEPLACYNRVVSGAALHFWTLTRGHAIAYKGSGGLTAQLDNVPYIMSTDDKAMIDRLKASLLS